MAKITLENGMIIEGTIEEFKQMGVKFLVETAEPNRLKVGDYVKVVDTTTSGGKHRSNIEVGEIMRIIEDDGTSAPYSAEKFDGSDYEWFREGTIVKATDEEVAEAKAKLAQKDLEAKWAKIGRNPNEFKEGDFVKYKKCFAEVTRVGSYDMSIEAPNGIIPIAFESASLITPVEARFDRADA
jgi:hypothetical protein